MNVAGRLFTFTSCACDFDAAKAFSTRYRILLCPIACFNIASKVFVVLSAIYTSASRKVRVGPAWCPAFAVQIRMPLAEAKGCPPPPSLCALVIDPVLHELQTLTWRDGYWTRPLAGWWLLPCCTVCIVGFVHRCKTRVLGRVLKFVAPQQGCTCGAPRSGRRAPMQYPELSTHLMSLQSNWLGWPGGRWWVATFRWCYAWHIPS